MYIVLILAVIIVLVVLLLAVITTSKAYSFKHTVDPINENTVMGQNTEDTGK